MYFLQVMVQPHNRHSSMSLYLATLAVVDTIVLIRGTEVSLIDQLPMNADWLLFWDLGQKSIGGPLG